MSAADSSHGSLNRFHLVVGIVLTSAGSLLALTLWKLLRRPNLDDDASQLCRLVSPRRSKDDDKRVQLKRQQGFLKALDEKQQTDSVENHEAADVGRQGSPRSLDMCSEHPVLKRQNTM